MSWLSGWAGFVTLVTLGWLLKQTVATLYLRVRARLDRDHPDDLPFGTGDWIRGAVRDRGIDVEVLPAPTRDQLVDAFMPTARKIILAQETYFKRDPSFWAVGAHELGHAIFHRALPGLDVVLVGARVFATSAATSGAWLISANVLYAAPEINRIAVALLIAGLGLQVIVLVDEAAASLIGWRIMARDRHLDAADVRGGATTLAVAFLTYVAGFGGLLLLVLEREFIIRMIEEHRHFEAAAPAGAGRLVLAAVLSLLLVLACAIELFLVARPPKVSTAATIPRVRGRVVIFEVIRGLIAVALVGLVWDQPLGVWFATACVLAVLASRMVVALLVGGATYLLFVVAVIVVRVAWWPFGLIFAPLFRGSRGPVAPRPPMPVAPRAEHDDVVWSAAQLERAAIERFNNPPWFDRLPRVAFAAAHIGFVFAFWVCLLMRN